MLREILVVNPRRKKSRKVRRTARRAVRRNPRRRKSSRRRGHRARFHRNPRFLSGLGLGGITKSLVPAVIGGAGTLGVDYLFNMALAKIPMSEELRAKVASPLPRALARGAVAFLGGWLAGKAFGKSVGEQITAGALTVIAYDGAKSMFGAQLGLSYYEGDLAAYERVGTDYNALPTLQRINGSGNGVAAYMRSDELNGLIPVTR